MTNALVLQHNKNKLYMKCTKHTHYYLRCKTNQYNVVSVNNILGIKVCFAIEPTSEGSVRLWALWRNIHRNYAKLWWTPAGAHIVWIISGGATPGRARSNDLDGRSTALAPPCLLLCFASV